MVDISEAALARVANRVDVLAVQGNGVQLQLLQELDMKQTNLVVALYRDGQVIIPFGDTELKEQDILYLMGRRETVTSFTRGLSHLGERLVSRRVMILGGGRAGFYLAQRLLTSGLIVKIIEQDEERYTYLAGSLKGALVICGDGTDLELLQDENLSDMDALVSLTGNDEENLMLALLGKQQGVPKVVAKVSRSNFVPLIEQLGMDRAVNPVLISAGELARFVQGGQIASLSLMFGGQAEVVEIVVPEEAPIIGRRLAEAQIPKGVIIGAIVRYGQVLIPDGTSVIEGHDRVIALTRGFWHELWYSFGDFYPNFWKE